MATPRLFSGIRWPRRVKQSRAAPYFARRRLPVKRGYLFAKLQWPSALASTPPQSRFGGARMVRYNNPYWQMAGSSLRDIASLANFARHLLLMATANPVSKSYGSHIDDWAGGNYHSFTLSIQAIARNKDMVLILKPWYDS